MGVAAPRGQGAYRFAMHLGSRSPLRRSGAAAAAGGRGHNGCGTRREDRDDRSSEQDYEGGFQLAVVLDDDPGKDLGMRRQPAHRFFFRPEEVEPLGW